MKALQIVFIYAHTPFVALDILEVLNMAFSNWIRLYYECFKLAGWSGLKACFRFMTGSLKLDENIIKSCDFFNGGSHA